MNVYRLALIGGKLVDIGEFSSVMVHGAQNYGEVQKMVNKGMTIDEIRKHFCGFCGGKMPCGCSNPEAQA